MTEMTTAYSTQKIAGSKAAGLQAAAALQAVESATAQPLGVALMNAVRLEAALRIPPLRQYNFYSKI